MGLGRPSAQRPLRPVGASWRASSPAARLLQAPFHSAPTDSRAQYPQARCSRQGFACVAHAIQRTKRRIGLHSKIKIKINRNVFECESGS